MAENSEKDGPHSLPMARIKSIVALVNDAMLPVSPEALFAFGKAAELFIEKLAKEVHVQCGDDMDYDELAAYIQDSDELDFLHDFFPKRITFKEALAKVQAQNNN